MVAVEGNPLLEFTELLAGAVNLVDGCKEGRNEAWDHLLATARIPRQRQVRIV